MKLQCLQLFDSFNVVFSVVSVMVSEGKKKKGTVIEEDP